MVRMLEVPESTAGKHRPSRQCWSPATRPRWYASCSGAPRALGLQSRSGRRPTHHAALLSAKAFSRCAHTHRLPFSHNRRRIAIAQHNNGDATPLQLRKYQDPLSDVISGWPRHRRAEAIGSLSRHPSCQRGVLRFGLAQQTRFQKLRAGPLMISTVLRLSKCISWR